MNDPEQAAQAAWERFCAADREMIEARRALFAPGFDHAPVLKKALRGPDRWHAIPIALLLKSDELLQLFPELVFLSSWGHGRVQPARDMIVRLPRDIVVEQIEAEAEPYLLDTEDEDNIYRRFLELYILLDRSLLARLVEWGAEHANPEIREAAADYAEKIAEAPINEAVAKQ